MRAFIKLCLLFGTLITIICFSCRKDTTSQYHLGEELQLKLGETLSVSTDNSKTVRDRILNVKFQDVLNDTRCAKESCYLCYGSSAKIQLHLSNDRINIFVPVPIMGCADEFPCNNNSVNRIDTMGYQICLLRLDPYPVVNQLYDPADYTAKIIISDAQTALMDK